MGPTDGARNRFSTALRALESPYRRQLLIALSEENPPDDAGRDPLNIVSEEGESDVSESELVHQHLPLLEQRGYIEWDWDQDTHTIEKGPNWGDIGPLIELLHEHRDELPDEWL